MKLPKLFLIAALPLTTLHASETERANRISCYNAASDVSKMLTGNKNRIELTGDVNGDVLSTAVKNMHTEIKQINSSPYGKTSETLLKVQTGKNYNVSTQGSIENIIDLYQNDEILKSDLKVNFSKGENNFEKSYKLYPTINLKNHKYFTVSEQGTFKTAKNGDVVTSNGHITNKYCFNKSLTTIDLTAKCETNSKPKVRAKYKDGLQAHKRLLRLISSTLMNANYKFSKQGISVDQFDNDQNRLKKIVLGLESCAHVYPDSLGKHTDKAMNAYRYLLQNEANSIKQKLQKFLESNNSSTNSRDKAATRN